MPDVQAHIAAIQPIVRLVQVYACPVCRYAQIDGAATDRYRRAQECCAPKVCPTCDRALPKNRVVCDPCWDAEHAAKEQAKWVAAPRVDVASLPKHMISAGSQFYSDLYEFLEDCWDRHLDPWDRRPFIAEWQTAHVPDLSGILSDDLPEDGCDWELSDIEVYLAEEFEKRQIGAYFAGDQVPILPTPEEWAIIAAAKTIPEFRRALGTEEDGPRSSREASAAPQGQGATPNAPTTPTEAPKP